MKRRPTKRAPDNWIHTAKLVLYSTLGFVRFVGESTPIQPPVMPTVSQPK